MSLHFTEDSMTKRQRQDIFRQTLDEQRRVNDQLRQQQHQQQQVRGHTQDEDVSMGRHLVSNSALLSADLDTNSRVIPGLDFDRVSSKGVLDRPSSGSSGGGRGKQPYMSALSEMNGRPLHVRQQQFEKESRYRNMLKDQIEENKRRKDAEKAKLEAEKRKELEEIQRLQQGNAAPRRQQHAQFQESPDHPLPSPGRLPPVSSYQQHLRKNSVACKIAPAYDAPEPDVYDRRDLPPRRGDTDAGMGWPGRKQGGPTDARGRRDHGGLHREMSGHSQQYPQHSRTAYPDEANDAPPPQGDYRARERRPPYPEGEFQANMPTRGDDGGDGCDTRSGAYPEGGLLGSSDQRGSGERRPAVERQEDGTSRDLAFHRDGPGRMTRAGGEGGGGRREGELRMGGDEAGFVPRSDFDELSNLCRELLLEQKQLRRKLEEKEERDRLAQQFDHRRQHVGVSAKPRRNSMESQRPTGLGAPSARENGIGRRSSGARPLQGQASNSTIHGERQCGVGPRRDSKAKPAVAFGSTVPRMGIGSKVERPRVGNGSSQITRNGGDRDLRISKSEQVNRLRSRNNENAGRTQARRQRTVSSDGAVTGSSVFDKARGSEPAWARRPGETRDDRTIGHAPSGESFELGAAGRRAMGRWATTRQANSAEDETSHKATVEGTHDGNTGSGGRTIHGLLGNGPRISTHAAEESAGDVGNDGRSNSRGAGSGYSELGGESTFLEANPREPGMGVGNASFGTTGGRAFMDPRGAADPWVSRR